MRIAILHMTMGLVDRGSEISVDLLATQLCKNNDILVLQSGKLKKSKFRAKRIYPLLNAPIAAPRNLGEKILFRLGLSSSTRHVVNFTLACVPTLSKFKPDVIIATNGGSQVKILRHNLPGRKIVVFGRAGIGHDDLDNLKSGPDLFIALSREAKEWAQANKKGKTIVEYLPNPIDLSLSKVKPKDLHILGPTLLVVGALTAYKNILPLVKVASSLNLNLVLIGDGEERDEIAKVLSQYQAEFRWIKHVEPSEIPAYYQAVDAFAFVPDSQEAFGRVYLEAMAAGLPIVATDDNIRRRLIGPKGIYVKLGDGLALQKALAYALSLPKMDYKKELEEYDLKLIAKSLTNLFKTICQNP